MKSFPAQSFPARAFSMVELLVVVAIFTILAVLTAPALPGLLGAKGVSKAASDVSSLFELARTEAVARSTFVFMGFEETTNSSGIPELRVSAAASPDGSTTTGLIPVSRMVRLPNIRLVGYSDIPSSLKVAATNATNPSSYVVAIDPPGIVFTNGTQIFNGTMLVVSPEGELLSSPDSRVFMPMAHVGLVQTRGTTLSTTDGAIVSLDGGSGATTITRP